MTAEFYEEEKALATQQAAAQLANGNGFAQKIVQEVNEQGFYTTLDISTMAGKKALYSATNASVLLRDFMETPLEIVNITFAPSEISDEDGNPLTTLGVFLTDENGTTYSSTSTGVLKSAMRIIANFGEPTEWGEQLTVVCKETNTSKGRRYKFLDVE